MKKIGSGFLIITLFLLNCISILTVSAAGTPMYKAENTIAELGEVFTINISISDNPGIISLRFKILYDTDVLELQSVSDNGLLSGFTNPSPTVTSPYTLRWADSLSNYDNTASGTIVTLTFKALKTIENTVITVEHGEARNYKGSKIAFLGTTVNVAIKELIPVAPDALALNENSNYKINETIGAVVVNPADKSGESLNAFMKNIATDHAYIQITDAIGNIKTSVSRLSTGYKVQILETDGSIKKTYTIVILGDTDGNGRYTLADVSGVQGYVITKPMKNTIDFLVADIDGNSRLSFVDASMLQKFM